MNRHNSRKIFYRFCLRRCFENFTCKSISRPSTRAGGGKASPSRAEFDISSSGTYGLNFFISFEASNESLVFDKQARTAGLTEDSFREAIALTIAIRASWDIQNAEKKI